MKKSMKVKELNELLDLAKRIPVVNYVTPTIHIKSGYVTTIIIHLYTESHTFTVVNNPNESYNLYEDVHNFLMTLKH